MSSRERRRRPRACCEPIEPPAPSTLDPARITIVGQRVEVRAGVPTDDGRERPLVHRGHLAHGVHAAIVELRGGDHTDTPQPFDRQRMQERQLAFGFDHEQAVGLADSARHLGEKFRPGDPDGDRQTHLVGDSKAEPFRDDPGCAHERHSPPTSRNASSIDIGSTIGVVSSKIAYTALLAST